VQSQDPTKAGNGGGKRKNKKGKKNGGGVDKKKVLPNKKFPELKLMISGEGRNSNNTFSSDEEAGIGNVSKIYFLN
jgi:hypothetical protein